MLGLPMPEILEDENGKPLSEFVEQANEVGGHAQRFRWRNTFGVFLAFAAGFGTFQFVRWLAFSDEISLALGFAVFIAAVLMD